MLGQSVRGVDSALHDGHSVLLLFGRVPGEVRDRPGPVPACRADRDGLAGRSVRLCPAVVGCPWPASGLPGCCGACARAGPWAPPWRPAAANRPPVSSRTPPTISAAAQVSSTSRQAGDGGGQQREVGAKQQHARHGHALGHRPDALDRGAQLGLGQLDLCLHQVLRVLGDARHQLGRGQLDTSAATRRCPRRTSADVLVVQSASASVDLHPRPVPSA